MKKWKVYLYYNRQCIKCLRINEDEKPLDNKYVITVFFKKHLFGSNYAKVIVKPILLKLTENDKRKIHIEVLLYDGVDFERGKN